MVKGARRSAIQGSKPAVMPGFIKPQLATLKSKAPAGDQSVVQGRVGAPAIRPSYELSTPKQDYQVSAT
jgi:hypothetical protein